MFAHSAQKYAKQIDLVVATRRLIVRQAFPEWRTEHPACVDSKGRPFKGRQCAKKMAPAFRHMEDDLHNLQPDIGEVNGLRFNYSIAMIPGEVRQFGVCDVEITDR